MSHIPDRNPSIVLTRKCEEDSTTNLLRHVKLCEGQVVNASKSIASYAHGSMYSKAKLHYLISLWVFKCHWPFTIIDNEPLQRILRMLYAKVETPSVTTMSKKSIVLWKSKSGRFSRYEYFLSFQLVPYELTSGSFLAIPWTNTLGFWWMDLAQYILVSWGRSSHCKWRAALFVHFGLHFVSFYHRHFNRLTTYCDLVSRKVILVTT